MAVEGPNGHERPLYGRLLWFAVLWLAGIAAVGTLALLLRRVIL